jgi:hypothetical protein
MEEKDDKGKEEKDNKGKDFEVLLPKAKDAVTRLLKTLRGVDVDNFAAQLATKPENLVLVEKLLQLKFEKKKKEVKEAKEPEEKDLKEFKPEELVHYILQAYRIWLSERSYDPRVLVVPNKPKKDWDWKNLTLEDFAKVKKHVDEKFPSLLQSIRLLELGSLLRWLYLGEIVYNARVFYEKNKNKNIGHYEGWFDFVNSVVPLPAKSRSESSYKRFYNVFLLVLKCPAVIFLFLEKENLLLTVNATLLSAHASKLKKYLKGGNAGISDERKRSLDLAACDIPNPIKLTLPDQIADAIMKKDHEDAFTMSGCREDEKIEKLLETPPQKSSPPTAKENAVESKTIPQTNDNQSKTPAKTSEHPTYDSPTVSSLQKQVEKASVKKSLKKNFTPIVETQEPLSPVSSITNELESLLTDQEGQDIDPNFHISGSCPLCKKEVEELYCDQCDVDLLQCAGCSSLQNLKDKRCSKCDYDFDYEY